MKYAQKSMWFLHFSHYPLKGSGRCYFSFHLTLGYKSDGWWVTGQLGQGQQAKGSRAMTQKQRVPNHMESQYQSKPCRCSN